MHNWILKDQKNYRIRNQGLYIEYCFCQQRLIFAWLDVKMERLHVPVLQRSLKAICQGDCCLFIFHACCSLETSSCSEETEQPNWKPHLALKRLRSVVVFVPWSCRLLVVIYSVEILAMGIFIFSYCSYRVEWRRVSVDEGE